MHAPFLALLLAVQTDPAGRVQAIHAQEGVVWAVMIPLGFITAICGITYLGRALIEHRRWLHASRLQTEAQSKVIDRLGSSDALLAYLQTPAAHRLLVLTPASTDRALETASPAARILWSVQTGIVLTLAGLGLRFGAGSAFEELADVLRIIATLAMAVGIGFVLSAAVSLVLSRRLGIIEPAPGSPS
jgi:hypothetical protein